MERIALTDGSGKWFDQEKAEEFSEGTEWDGNNHISLATRSQTEHEMLYRTKSGRWVLRKWSQWQGSIETWEEIDDIEAAKWLVRNEHDSNIVRKEIDELEI